MDKEKLFSKIEKTDSCWIWKGSDGGNGYGEFHMNGKSVRAHRAVYELLVGKIPKGLVIDHLCRNRICVNPKHLEPVTQKVNILRGTGASARNAKKTYCLRGHELKGRNMNMTLRGWRRCRRCNNDWSIKDRLKRKKLRLSTLYS